MPYTSFIQFLTGRVFKLLPMKEADIIGRTDATAEYIGGLIVDIDGAKETFPELYDIHEYVSVSNIVKYLAINDVEYEIFRREVLRALRLLNSVTERGVAC